MRSALELPSGPGRRLLVASVCVAVTFGCQCGEPVPDSMLSGLDFVRETPTFPNYADELTGWALDVDDAVALFGAEAVCVPESSPCVVTELAQAWIDDVNETLKHGHSEGIALTTLAFEAGTLSPSDFGAGSVAELSLTNPALMRAIARRAATQKIPAALARDRSFQAKDVMPFLTTALMPDRAEQWRLAVVIKDEAGFRAGHSLVPFGFFRGAQAGQFVIRVYDSNWPGQEKRLFVDTRANTWTYAGSENAASPRSYSGDATNGNLLYFSPLSAHEGPFTAPFAADARTLVVAASGSGVTLKDEGGAEVGVTTSGQVTEKGGAVRPAFAQSPCVLCPAPAETVNYTLSPDAGMGGRQTISLENFGNNSADGGTVNVTGAGLSVRMTGVRTETSGALLEVQGQTVTYSSAQSSTPTTVTVTVAGPNGSSTTVTVSLSSSPLGTVTIDASDPNNVTVTVRNQLGEAVSGTVTVTNTASNGQKKTTTAAIEAKQGSTSTASVQPGVGATVRPAPGTACDNGRLDRTVADGGTLGAETDVDCGGLCPGCGERKRCLVGADCQSGVCAANVCQRPSCFDNVRNGTELEPDCGGSCFQSCRVGQMCRSVLDCGGTLGAGPACVPDPDGGVTRCRQTERRTLLVTGLGADSQFNLNGTSIDGVSYADWRVTGNATSSVSVPFVSHRYTFRAGADLPAPYQSNLNCQLVNPTNEPELLRQGGYGDGGQPSLVCSRQRTSLVARLRGCAGLGVPFTARLDSASRSFDPQLSGSGADINGVATVDLGTYRTDATVLGVYRGSVRYGTGPGGVAVRQSCPEYSQLFTSAGNRTWAEATYDCTCMSGDFRGPTTAGNPCTNAQSVSLSVGTGRQLQGNTAENSKNDFVFLPDAGCAGNADLTQSGSDQVYRVTVPAGADLTARTSNTFDLSVLPSLAACGTNSSTSATTGTVGATCSARSYAGFGLKHYNPGPGAQDVYVVVDGRTRGSQGPYDLVLTMLPHSTTVTGSPCSAATPVSLDGGYAFVSGSIGLTNNFAFAADSTGCAASGPPNLSARDVAYRFDVPPLTRVDLNFTRGACEVVTNFVKGTACGMNGPGASASGTTGISCTAASNPYQCAYTLTYQNRTTATETAYLVVESGDVTTGATFAFTATTRAVQLTQYQTVAGPAVDGNPCQLTQVRSGAASYRDEIFTQRNDFYVPSSSTCVTTSLNGATPSPSGPDTAIGYELLPNHELAITAEAYRPYQQPPTFFLRAVAGEAACGVNGSNFVDAGTVGLTCSASAQARQGYTDYAQELRYTNASAATQAVYVVLDAVDPLPAGIRYEVFARIFAPDGGVDGGVADAGAVDAGRPDAGPPDAGPPDAGPPDAGPPDAGPPDAGPPDAGAPDAGPPDAGPADAGPTDSGTPDAGPTPCSTDSQCPSNNCYCAGNSGNCAGAGQCAPGRAVISMPTTGTTVSGTFTVPAACTQVFIAAWGSGGGEAEEMFPGVTRNSGGAGGYVSGLLSVAPGDVITAWVGRGGQNSSGIMGDEGAGSAFGTAANGGGVEVGTTAGGGGGLTSVRQTGSVTRSFVVPAGGGAGLAAAAQPAGGMGAGSASTLSGGNAQTGTEGGGGGAGQNGGNGASTFQGAGDPGAYGTLPSGLTSENGTVNPIPGMASNPAQTATQNYALCPSGTGAGRGGNGCVVVRCAP
ncbi:MAG: hypothetical protein JNJ54_15270 [Myxococcaceae bacterium]|nr:hypothetical protein [Myxococcaceae bacterium]